MFRKMAAFQASIPKNMMTSAISNKSQTNNPPIILLHGWGMNKNVWQLVLASLEKSVNNKIITLDLPGYGDNQDLPEPYDLTQLASWLGQKITEPSIIVGWSLGGLVAQRTALLFPEKVVKLGLIGSSAKFIESEDWPGIKPDVLQLFAKQLGRDHKQTIERFMAIQAMGSEHAKQDIKLLKDLVLDAAVPNGVALERGLAILADTDLRAEFSQIAVPIHALFGRLDSLVSVKNVVKLQTLNSQLVTQVLPKSSHAPFVSDPEDFCQWFVTLAQ